MGDHTRIFVRSLNRVRADHLERYLFAGTRVSGNVLDAACGCGYGTEVLKIAGCSVVGVDIEPDAINFAKENWPGATYAQLDLNKDAILWEFDSVVSFETLEHLEKPEVALRAFAEVSPKLICSVPNELQMPFNAKKFAGDLYPHLRHYTPNQFDELLSSNGWVVKERHSQVDKAAPVTEGVDGIFLVYVCETK